MKTTYIYALIDPRDDQVRYVGKADNVKERFMSHLRESKTNAKSHKCAWIRTLIAEGLKPVVKTLEEVNIDEWQKAEIYYIQEFRKMGVNLTNHTIGGDGFHTGFVQDQFFLMKVFWH
jgi:hypothetical protein